MLVYTCMYTIGWEIAEPITRKVGKFHKIINSGLVAGNCEICLISGPRLHAMSTWKYRFPQNNVSLFLCVS